MRREFTFVAKARCRFENCQRIEHSRGLCSTHYQVALKEVKEGYSTWERYERQGKSVKKRRRAAEWFREEIAV